MLGLIVHSDITLDDTIGEGRIYARPDSPPNIKSDDIIGEGRMYGRPDSPL